ncbi:hypothetical protein [Paenibacillus sp. IHBB 10380]|uniref:hypothetical protein n=1 Tax=Paenibacillus sp. IHBB 10380 TaxID=1566358 RepID=UPI0005CFC21D|nr:hypothetical protein [Paenibacillus sp. IHBB 10380]AJS59186.1 hypothetical protein UB51_12725 [Paenibacillus sp. IHBB 10380]
MPVKYLGKIIEIMYMDQSGKITQRRIEVNSIRNGLIRATCLMTGSPRTFRIDNILAWQAPRTAVREAV